MHERHEEGTQEEEGGARVVALWWVVDWNGPERGRHCCVDNVCVPRGRAKALRSNQNGVIQWVQVSRDPCVENEQSFVKRDPRGRLRCVQDYVGPL